MGWGEKEDGEETKKTKQNTTKKQYSCPFHISPWSNGGNQKTKKEEKEGMNKGMGGVGGVGEQEVGKGGKTTKYFNGLISLPPTQLYYCSKSHNLSGSPLHIFPQKSLKIVPWVCLGISRAHQLDQVLPQKQVKDSWQDQVGKPGTE